MQKYWRWDEYTNHLVICEFDLQLSITVSVLRHKPALQGQSSIGVTVLGRPREKRSRFISVKAELPPPNVPRDTVMRQQITHHVIRYQVMSEGGGVPPPRWPQWQLVAVLRQLPREVHPPLSLVSTWGGVGFWDIQPTCHMCTLYLAQMAFGALQWGCRQGTLLWHLSILVTYDWMAQ